MSHGQEQMRNKEKVQIIINKNVDVIVYLRINCP